MYLDKISHPPLRRTVVTFLYLILLFRLAPPFRSQCCVRSALAGNDRATDGAISIHDGCGCFRTDCRDLKGRSSPIYPHESFGSLADAANTRNHKTHSVRSLIDACCSCHDRVVHSSTKSWQSRTRPQFLALSLGRCLDDRELPTQLAESLNILAEEG